MAKHNIVGFLMHSGIPKGDYKDINQPETTAMEDGLSNDNNRLRMSNLCYHNASM
jgi:hypothetical protein